MPGFGAGENEQLPCGIFGWTKDDNEPELYQKGVTKKPPYLGAFDSMNALAVNPDFFHSPHSWGDT